MSENENYDNTSEEQKMAERKIGPRRPHAGVPGIVFSTIFFSTQ
jgi:hypothetical protein